jgi:hypothetical protein
LANHSVRQQIDCAINKLAHGGCDEGDISCVCMDHKFLKDIAGCIKGECNKSDQKGTLIHPYNKAPSPP